MLESLYVKNLALIDKTEICFTPGLNILSGETGAGKSIIIGSVMIALGSKVPRDMIRNHEKEAYIELVFSVHRDSVRQKLSEMDISLEDDQMIISRRITETRSVCRINGETVTAARVREVAAMLLDVHGQHEHQKLLQGARQLEIVDRFGQSGGIGSLRQEVAVLYRQYQTSRAELEKSSIDEAVRIRTVDILNFEIEEIEQARISPGEEQELEREWKRLRNQGLIQQGLNQMEQCISSEEGGAGDLLGRALSCAKELTEYDPKLEGLYSSLMDAESIVSDCSHTVSRLLEDQENQEERYTEVGQRLDEIRHLMQKYSCDENGLIFLLQEKKNELEGYLHLEETKKKLEKQVSDKYRRLEQKAKELTELRMTAKSGLEKRLTEAMIDLNFLDVRFEIRMHSTAAIGHNGKDEAEFYISTNPGEELRPLSMVASGGELSRIMLAIKSVLAENEETETLIFDEIDAGISGRTAQKVADRLCATAKGCQVICISHLPQIVSMADTHFLIEKDVKDRMTATHIRLLDREESVCELARLLGGTEITGRVMENAREMKDMASKSKRGQSVS